MSYLRKTFVDTSGQTMIMVSMIVLVLMIGGAAVYFVNQMMMVHITGSNKRLKSRAVAEEGINIAIQELSTDGSKWQNALTGNFTGTDCNGAELTSPSGSHFYISCSTGTAGNPNLQPYEVAIKAVAMEPGSGGEVPIRAMQAYVSRRALGADLATGFHAPAALYLMSQPAVSGTLDVQWGPIVLLDANNQSNSPWTLSGSIDQFQYPRKFSVGGITGSFFPRSANGPTTDAKEYWADAPLTAAPLIDENSYIVAAEKATGITPPTSLQSGSPITATNCLPSLAANPTCGYFQSSIQNDTAVFDGTPYYSLTGNPTIYVNGWAQFGNIRVDSATVIVTGQLLITNAATGYQPNLHVPITAPSEYPYMSGTWPCHDKWPDQQADGTPTYGCSASQIGTGNVQFHGFLDVKGNMLVRAGASGWTLAGALMVGDPNAAPGVNWNLQIDSGANLFVVYDDLIGQAILTNPIAGGTTGTVIKVVPDQIRDIAL